MEETVVRRKTVKWNKPAGARRKANRRKRLVLYALMGVCIAAVAFFAVGFGIELYASRQSITYYAKLTEEVARRPPRMPAPEAPGQEAQPTDAPPGPPGASVADSEPADEEEPWIPYVDFEALGESFPGIIGWLLLEGTPIDYPIMQTADNSYFLSHLPDGARQRAGAIFLDYRNSPGFTDANSLIYGHMSNSGEMFGALRNYRNQEFYDKNRELLIFTPERDYGLVLIAGYLLDSGVEVPPLEFSGESDFEAYIDDIRGRSFFISDVGVGEGDRIVCLCTCAYDFRNARLIIVGKLVDLGGRS